MKTKTAALVSSLMLLAACGVQSNASSSVKSPYPIDYPLGPTCQQQGPLRVCRALQMAYGVAVLDINYTGDAINTSNGAAVFVKIPYQNGDQEGLFQSLSTTQQGTTFRITGGCLVAASGQCAKPGTAEMRSLLLWAARYGGVLNAIDFEVAVTDNRGNWDSLNGGNYHFHFDQQ